MLADTPYFRSMNTTMLYAQVDTQKGKAVDTQPSFNPFALKSPSPVPQEHGAAAAAAGRS